MSARVRDRIDHMEVLTKMLEYGFDPACEIQLSLDAEMIVLKVPEYERAFLLFGKDKIFPISVSPILRSAF